MRRPLAPRRRRADAVTFLTVYLVLLCAIPSYLVIPALGSVGRLSVLWGLVGLAWWIFTKLAQPASLSVRANPVKVTLLAFFCMVCTTYAVVNLRGIPLELTTSVDSSLIRLLSWTGMALIALDGIRTREQLVRIAHRIAWAGALMSALGLLQFATGRSFVDSITLPGFTVGSTFELGDRAGFARAAGTAAHPLEYGTLLSLSLPLALALAVRDAHRVWYLRWFPPSLIAIAGTLSMTRSTMIGVLIGLVLLAPALPHSFRIRAAALGALWIGAMSVVVPGMIGTIRGMFLGIGNDSSTVSRTDSAGIGLAIAARHPWLGGGFGTFLPREVILDNQILLLDIECGALGLAAFLGLILASLITGWRVAQSSADATDKLLGPALSASVAAGSSTLFFFDGLSFPIAAGMLFLVYGITGAAWEIVRTDRLPSHQERGLQ